MTTFLLISLSQHSHQQLHVASPPQQAHPGAFPVRGSRITPQHDSFLNGDNDFATHEIQKWTRPAGTCNTIQCWTCGWFRTCQQCLSCWRWSRRNSPMSTSSEDCFVNIFGNWHLRFHPNSAPSVSPSQSLFGFLAEHSFDNGTALSTTGSSQKRHLQGWRSKSTLYNSATDYVVLQFYVLAVFNYATGDLLSGESWLHDNGTASEYNFCDWDNTDCNDGRTDITALSPLGSQLFGSLTPEIACCHMIPWNRPCHMRLIADYFFLHSVRCPPPSSRRLPCRSSSSHIASSAVFTRATTGHKCK